MTPIFIDFESYYDRDYTLSKMPTMQYVRDPRWQCEGAAVCIPGAVPPTWYDEPAMRELFDRLPWDRLALVAHNARFDYVVLSHHYGHRPAQVQCTKDTAQYAVSQGWLDPNQTTGVKALAPRYGLEKGDTAQALEAGGQALADYALTDLLVSMRIYEEFWPRVPALERGLIDLHARMAAEPFLRLDTGRLDTLTGDVPPWQAQLRSKEAFAQALRTLGVEPQTKTSPTTGKPDYAFAKKDPFMRSLHVHPDPRVRQLVALREEASSSIERTRAARMLEVGSPFPVPLTYYGAHTGRASGADKLNLQNLGQKSPLRKAIQAPPGHKLVICDSAQAEVRVLAWLAGAKALLHTLIEYDAGRGPDPYIAFASEVMTGKPYDQVSREERRQAKPPVLAAGFGQSAPGLVAYAESFGIPLDAATAHRAVQGYRQRYPEIVAYWDRIYQSALRDGENQLPSGRKLVYPDIERVGMRVTYQRAQVFSKKRKAVRDKVNFWHGLATENAVQAAARDVVMWQTLQLARRWRVVLSVHDEVVLCVPERLAEDARHDAEQTFSLVPDWAQGLPVRGEAVISDDYGVKP